MSLSEVRFPQILHLAMTEVLQMKALCCQHDDLSTHAGFLKAVLELLGGLAPTEALSKLSVPELAKLLYQDDLVFKHTASKTVRKALSRQAAASLPGPDGNAAICGDAETAESQALAPAQGQEGPPGPPVTVKEMCQHLLQAHW